MDGYGGQPAGLGRVDDESVAALRWALELGATFFGRSDVHGAGPSERVLGRALAGDRDSVVIATKWGNLFDERSAAITGADDSPEHARQALHASLRRLGTDYVDLLQFHLSGGDLEQAPGCATCARSSWRRA